MSLDIVGRTIEAVEIDPAENYDSAVWMIVRFVGGRDIRIRVYSPWTIPGEAVLRFDDSDL